MIKTLQKKFIFAAMLSLTIVLLVIGGLASIINYHRIVINSETIISVLVENDGKFPEEEGKENGKKESEHKGKDNEQEKENNEEEYAIEGKKNEEKNQNGKGKGDGDKKSQGNLSVETPYESRYFLLRYDESNTLIDTDIKKIAAVDETAASQYADTVLASNKTSGFYKGYRFAVTSTETGVLVVFLDCGRTLDSFYKSMAISFAIGVIGLLAVYILLRVFSYRIVKPIAESYEKQKQFITDAGHELKTPLTIISADTELVELETGDNEWLDDIKQQVTRLTKLTNDLIFLSRMDEGSSKTMFINFPLSDVVEEEGRYFTASAKSKELTLRINIEPMLSLTGDEKGIRKLVSILMENAVKYTPQGGEISLSLTREKHSIKLEVVNTTEDTLDKEMLNRLFDRFYRGEKSRNSESGGYGLGLSIARGITEQHHGKIKGITPEDKKLCISVELPETE